MHEKFKARRRSHRSECRIGTGIALWHDPCLRNQARGQSRFCEAAVEPAPAGNGGG